MHFVNYWTSCVILCASVKSQHCWNWVWPPIDCVDPSHCVWCCSLVSASYVHVIEQM